MLAFTSEKCEFVHIPSFSNHTGRLRLSRSQPLLVSRPTSSMLSSRDEVVVRQGALAPIMKSVFPDSREYGRSVPVLPPMKDGKPVLRTFRPRPELFEAGI